jgi:hypothetical protein
VFSGSHDFSWMPFDAKVPATLPSLVASFQTGPRTGF